MHRLESFLVAIELKDRLAASFPEGAEVSADGVSAYVSLVLIFCRIGLYVILTMLVGFIFHV